ncbi:MAG TPA: cyclic-phosphate processing receiver domain-containing protein [Pirellulales bacterium]|nr:cyclic-phosphate processing receiver domain-containing protein [Pirellulales bacterium]
MLRSRQKQPPLILQALSVPIIALLDDEPDRIDAMRPLLAERCPGFEVVVFENSPDMLDWLGQHLGHVQLLLLDHDLGPNQFRNGASFDPGTGRDVADFLATRPPQCHVILHTTNFLAAPGMRRVLEDAGWTVSHVVPYGDLDWVPEAWNEEVERVMKELR